MKFEGFVAALLSQHHLPLPVYFTAETDVERICRTVCAYLNDNGGWVIVGVDSAHNVTGVSNNTLGTVQSALVSSIIPMPLVYVQEDNFEGECILLITVMKGSLPPYTYNGIFYIMQGQEACAPSADQMACLLRDSYSIRSGWEADNCLIGDEDMLDYNLMEKVYAKGMKSGRIRDDCLNMNEVLSELQLLTISSVTNGALCLFSRDTARVLPQCRIRIQVMLNGKTADKYEDAPTYITGNIFSLLDQVLVYFKKRLPLVMSFFTDDSSRDDIYLYPLDVIDEAVSNALIHRDYTNRIDEITIFIYSDRIEITNSGEMPKGMLTSINKVAPHNSVLRNPLMAEVFYIYGQMEKTGRGLLLISDTMRAKGSKLPEWRTANGKTTLTIYSTTGKTKLSQRASEFIRRHKSGHVFTKTEYAEQCGISTASAYLDIKSMLVNDKIETTGSGPKTCYVIRQLNDDKG